MSSPWHGAHGALPRGLGKLCTTQKAPHPTKIPMPHIWPSTPSAASSGAGAGTHLSPLRRPRCFPLSVQQPANITSGFNSLPNLQGSNLYFPWERCSTMLNSSLVRGKNKVFFILAFQAELLYKQEHECPEAKKQTRSA